MFLTRRWKRRSSTTPDVAPGRRGILPTAGVVKSTGYVPSDSSLRRGLRVVQPGGAACFGAARGSVKFCRHDVCGPRLRDAVRAVVGAIGRGRVCVAGTWG